MSLQDRIESAKTELLASKDALVEATKSLEAAPNEEALLVECDELSQRVEKQTETLTALERAEKALADRAKPIENASMINSQQFKSQGKEDGDLMFKYAAAKFKAFAQKRELQEVIATDYAGRKDVEAVAGLMTKTAVAPADTTTSGWALELVQTDVQGFINTLRTTSVAAALASKSRMLNFGGFDSITVPRRNPLGATLTEPAWVGEGGVIPLTQFSFGSTKINRYKLAAITTMTREIADRSTPAIEGLLRDALSESYSEVLDAAFLSNAAAVAGVRPAGLLNGLTTAGATAGGGEAAVIADLKKMLAAFEAARTGSRPVLLMNTTDRLSLSMLTSPMSEFLFRDELASGRLLGIEVVSSANVPQGTIVMVDADSLVTAFDAPMFDVSDVATVTEANADGTAPTQAGAAIGGGALGTAGQVIQDGGIPVSGGTGASTTGYTARSLWQTYSLGIRMVAPTSWSMVRPSSVGFISSITW